MGLDDKRRGHSDECKVCSLFSVLSPDQLCVFAFQGYILDNYVGKSLLEEEEKKGWLHHYLPRVLMRQILLGIPALSHTAPVTWTSYLTCLSLHFFIY